MGSIGEADGVGGCFVAILGLDEKQLRVVA